MQNVENQYLNIALVKLYLFYFLGIVGFLYFKHIYSLFLFSFVFVLVLVLKKKLQTNTSILKSNSISSKLLIAMYLVFFSLGYSNAYLYKTDLHPKHFSEIEKTKKLDFVKVKLTEYPIEKENSFKANAEVQSLRDGEKILTLKGQIICYFSKDESVKKLKDGDIFYIRNSIQKIEEPKNPNEFDYKKYLSYKNISHQVYLREDDYQIVSKGNNVFSSFLNTVKQKLQTIINENINQEDERSVASALLLGNRNFISDDILKSFSNTGSTHVLAVSGLHVGLFYSIISFSFSWLKRFKHLKILHPIITIFFIWFYVVLTGGSPSVVRAAAMFTLFAIGFSLKRHIDVFNIIAFSAFLITVYNPFLITDVGFQLSYLAVIGIIYLQPKIYKWLYVKNYILDKLWAITAVSIAAQISTFPLIILYFHQFPNYSLLSNIVVIPAATIILYGGIIMFVFSWNAFLLNIIGKFLSAIIFVLNEALRFIQDLPNAITSNLYINLFQALVLFLLIVLFVFALEKRNKIILKYFLIFALILSGSFAIKTYKTNYQKSFTVYNVPKFSAFEITNSKNNFSSIDSLLLQNESTMNFRIAQNWGYKQIKNQASIFDALNTTKIGKNKMFSYSGKKILLIDKEFSIPNIDLKVDYVIVSHSPKLYLKTFTKKITATTFIFDTSNDRIKEKYWKQDCDSLGINCYFVSDSVAYQINF